jgi:hypothetical protein
LEARRLSSRATPIYKFGALGFLSLWLLLSIVAAAHSQRLDWVVLLFPILGGVLLFVTYLLVGRAKKVEFVGDVFIVSSGSRTVEVPIRDVEAVGGSRFSNPERMWLDLRRPTDFGSRIHFLPPQRWFNFFSQHPLVAELRSIVESGAAPGRAPVEQPKSWPWWQRVAIGAAGFLAFAGILTVGVTVALKSSDPYQRALSAVQNSPLAREQLGPPIVPGWFVTGSIQTSEQRGSAEMAFQVSGVRSEGTVRLSASREEGLWEFSLLELDIAGGSIDLLNE